MIHYADTALLNIAYLEQGTADKPAVLLLHGWPDDATAWAEVMPGLMNAGYRVIAPWLRGFGDTRFKSLSTPRTGNSGMLAYDAIALMDERRIDQFSIAGHDWGSNIAEALAVGWPDRVNKIALLSSPPRLGGAPTPPFKHAQLEWYHWFMATKRGEEAVRHDPIGFAHIMWENWSPEGWYDQNTFQKTALSWQNPDFVDVTLHSYRARWNEAEPDPQSAELEQKIKSAKTLSLPTLYIQGQADGVNPPYVSENIHEKFSGEFKRMVLHGVGHFPAREAPDEVTGRLLEFFDS